jgi:hypothetical protein
VKEVAWPFHYSWFIDELCNFSYLKKQQICLNYSIDIQSEEQQIILLLHPQKGVQPQPPSLVTGQTTLLSMTMAQLWLKLSSSMRLRGLANFLQTIEYHGGVIVHLGML